MMLHPKELRSRRMALGLSLEDFARAAKIEPSLIGMMESGEAAISPAIVASLTRLEERAGNPQLSR
jgi:transcriptional regulator with XRE-family HTH domain